MAKFWTIAILLLGLHVHAQPFTQSELAWIRGVGGSTVNTNFPPDTNNIIEWLDATTLSAGTINTWVARVGQDATTAESGLAAPTQSGTGSSATVSFDGSTMGLRTPLFIGEPFNQPWSIAIVYSYQGPITSTCMVGSTSPATYLGTVIVNTNLQVNVGTQQVFGGPYDHAQHILFMVFNGAASVFGQDGNALTLFPGGSPGGSGVEDLSLGYNGNQAMAQCNISEIVVWSVDESANYLSYKTYANGKW